MANGNRKQHLNLSPWVCIGGIKIHKHCSVFVLEVQRKYSKLITVLKVDWKIKSKLSRVLKFSTVREMNYEQSITP